MYIIIITCKECALRIKSRIIQTIDPGIEHCLIPCFCIQSLIENAYVHGLEPKPSDGTLEITIKKSENFLSITVADDGVGFETIPSFSLDSPVAESKVIPSIPIRMSD